MGTWVNRGHRASGAHTSSPVMVLAIAALVLLCAGTLAACGSKSAASSTKATTSGITLQNTTPPGTHTVSQITWNLPMGEPTSLDYAKAGYTSIDTVVSNLNDNLLRYTPDWKLTPCIAESWSNPNPTTLIYTIRQGVKFWDGHPLTAADVVYSLKRQLDPKVASVWSVYFTNVKDIKQTGPFQVTVSFKQPDELFNKEMGTAAGGITEKAYVQKVGEAKYGSGINVMGSGPYKLVAWKPGSEIDLQANPDYWDPNLRPKVQKVTVKFITDTSTLTSALLSGEVDGSYEISPTVIPALKPTSTGKLFFGPSLDISELLPASPTGPMANPELRKALSMAIDRVAIAEKIYNGAAVPNKTFTPPTAWDPEALSVYKAAWDALPPITPDVAGAKQIVASQPNAGKAITLAFLAGDQRYLEVASVVQQAGKEIGLKIKLKQMPALDYSNAFYLPQYRKGIDLLLTLGYLDVPDPLDYLLYWFGPSAFFNWTNYKNTTVDSDVAEAQRTFDAAKRAQLITDAQKSYTNDAIAIPICNDDVVLFMNNRISGAPVSFTFLWQPAFAMIGGTK